MKILKTPLKDLLVIQNKRFDDNRGYFRELLIEKKIKKKFCFNVVSVSKKNVIRGLHFQIKKPQGKFISVIKGKIIDVAVDLRKNSKTFGKHFKIILSAQNCTSIFIPEGVDALASRQKLLNDFNLEIGAGLGVLAGKIWRIGLMGSSSNKSNIDHCLESLKQVI